MLITEYPPPIPPQVDDKTTTDYYKRGKIEVWDFILDQNLDYLLGNVVKYVCRCKYKGDMIGDLKKARAYLDKEIATLEES